MSKEIEQVVKTFHIPAFNLPQLEEKMAKLSKRAKRLKSGDVGFRVLRTYEAPSKGEADLEFYRTMHEIEVFGPRPKFAGWSFVGRLDFKNGREDMPIRAMVPGETLSENFYMVDAKRCDHCGYRRRRNDSFVLRHDDGREMLVGRSCLKDFLGHASPEKLARLAEIVAEMDDLQLDDVESFPRYGSYEVGYEPTVVVCVAIATVRSFG